MDQTGRDRAVIRTLASLKSEMVGEVRQALALLYEMRTDVGRTDVMEARLVRLETKVRNVLEYLEGVRE